MIFQWELIGQDHCLRPLGLPQKRFTVPPTRPERVADVIGGTVAVNIRLKDPKVRLDKHLCGPYELYP
jgi:hypothetical protein